MNKKIMKKLSTNMNLFVLFVSFMLGITLIISGMYMFMSGYHNVDSSHNYTILELKYNIDLVDTGSNFQTFDLEHYYILGFNLLVLGLFVTGIGLFILGYYVCVSLVIYEKYLNKVRK